MKTLVMISFADPTIKNGQGIFAKSVLENLAAKKKDNVKLILIAPNFNNYAYSKSIENLGIDLIYLPKKKRRSLLWQFIVNLLVLEKLWHLRPSLLIHSIKPFSFFILALPLLKIKYGLLVEGLAYETLKNLPFKFVHKIAHIIYPFSAINSKFIISCYPRAFNWISDLIKTYSFKYNKNCLIEHKMYWCGVNCRSNIISEKNNSQSIKITYVGSFRKIHELKQLIDLVKKHEIIEATLVGSGDESKNLFEYVKKINLTKRIEFKGSLESSKWIPIVQKSDFTWGVINKNCHGVPIKVFESIYMGKISLVSNLEEFKELKEKGWVYVINQDDTSFDIRDLVNLKKNPPSSLDMRQYAERNFSWEKYCNLIYKYLN